jgi:hypothetical protein
VQAVSIATSELRRSTRERAKSALNLLFAEPPIPTKRTYEQDPQAKLQNDNDDDKNISQNLFVRVAYLKGDNADQDATYEEDERDDEPDDTPNYCFLKFVKEGASDQHVLAQIKRYLGLPCEGKQPQILAKADASEAFTFRAIVSSAGRKTTHNS